MRKFIVMARAAQLWQNCGHKRCVRRDFYDRWFDYMCAVNGRERLARHEAILIKFYDDINHGRRGLLRVADLEVAEFHGMS